MTTSTKESSKIVPFGPLEGRSIVEMGPEKEVEFSSSTPEKDRENIHSADTREFSSSEMGSRLLIETDISMAEAPRTAETCSANVSLPVLSSEVLELGNSGVEGEKMEGTDAPTVSLSSGFSVERKNCDNDQTGVINEVDVASSEIQAFGGYNCEDESLNLDEKGKETEVQRLLEAEKERLLAEIDVETIFREKANADTVTSDSEFLKNGKQQETVKRMILKDHAFVKRSMKVEVIDDTAVVDVVQNYKKGCDHSKRLETSRADEKNLGEMTVNRKQGKGTRGNGKGKGNAAKVDKKSGEVSEFRDLGGKKGNPKITYTRKQMEALRFAKIADQRKLWNDIYTALPPEVMTEYEGLACLKSQKISKTNHGQPILRNRGIGILGPIAAAVPRRNHLNIFAH